MWFLQVTRVILLWVNNHFNDFEGDPAMTHFLEEFENNLEKEVSITAAQWLVTRHNVVAIHYTELSYWLFIPFQKMCGHLRLLNIACAAKAKPRLVTLTKPSRDSPLAFSLLGGQEKGFRIFIDAVDPGSKAAEVGLKRGDQVTLTSSSSLLLQCMLGVSHKTLDLIGCKYKALNLSDSLHSSCAVRRGLEFF